MPVRPNSSDNSRARASVLAADGGLGLLRFLFNYRLLCLPFLSP